MNLTLDIINSLLLACIKPAIVLAVVIYLVNRVNHRGAAANHWILLIGLFSPVLLVLLFIVLPAWNLNILPASFGQLTKMTIISGSRGPLENPNTLTLLFLAIYFFGFVWIVSYLIVGVIAIADKTRSSQLLDDADVQTLIKEIANRYRIKRWVTVRVNESINSPLMWGLTKPVILLPEKFQSWSKQRLQRVLAHEMAHIARNDWLIKLLANIVRAIFWFLPPVWWVARKLEWYAELACDDLLITHYQCRAEYADDLLLLSSEFQHDFFALSFIKRSELYQRIDAVLDGSRVREAPARSVRFLMLLWAIVLLLPLSMMYPTANSSVESSQDYYSLVVDNNVQAKPTDPAGTLFNSEPVNYLSLEEIRKNYFLTVSEPEPEELIVIGGIEVAVNKADTEKVASYRVDPGEPAKPALSSVQVEGYLPLIIKTPRYPTHALKNNIEGRVIVQFDISDRGQVLRPRIVASQPAEIFDSVVLQAIKKFTFTPLKVNGKAIITKNVTETFVFKIEDTTDKPKANPRLTTAELVRK